MLDAAELAKGVASEDDSIPSHPPTASGSIAAPLDERVGLGGEARVQVPHNASLFRLWASVYDGQGWHAWSSPTVVQARL